ncbi:serine/threonine protein kinase [Gordonia araii NBRC 100433]|uniref:non-specific serine/threonine protein kinase n=1 Tax=Gordonia araii NBRC 100433 TaxID=1073574 RepID=G7H390_9ACTN|nr:serine/threonine protein kinase [Gordonia araii NBRC 100433]
MGDDIAGYRIVDVLGSGGMGEVYRAQHPRLPRTDAVKVLRAAHISDAEVRGRFEREADVIAPIVHPNIVRVYDRGEVDGALWIAMEWVPGTDVARLLANHPGGLGREQVAAIVTGVAAGLDAAHRHGVTHRDVKPANILVTPGDAGAVKLGDFGIARAIEDGGGLTGTGMAVGTMRYASPEQINGGAIGARSDVYSLAATTFELLTGAPPFIADSLSGVMSAHLFAQVPSAHQRNPGLPRDVDDVLTRAMAKDPAHRYATAGEFAGALLAALNGETGARTLVGPRFADPGRGGPPGAIPPPPASSPQPMRPPATPPPGAVPSLPYPPPGFGAMVAPPRPSKVRRALTAAAVLVVSALVGGLVALWQNSAAALAAPDRPDTTVTKYAVEVTWQPVADATEYVVKRGDAEVYAGPETTFRDPLPLPGVYQYSVSARSPGALPSRFSLKSTPTTVYASWRQVQWMADLYPDLVPASPLSSNGYDQVNCWANAPVYFDDTSQVTITCQKIVGNGPRYGITVYGYPNDPAGRAAAKTIVFHRTDGRQFTSAQGNRGSVHRYPLNDTQCAGIDFEGEKRALTLVEVCVTKGTVEDAVRLAERLPM